MNYTALLSFLIYLLMGIGYFSRWIESNVDKGEELELNVVVVMLIMVGFPLMLINDGADLAAELFSNKKSD